jgi:alpha-beta hydrolase superfamily lysophospholipase
VVGHVHQGLLSAAQYVYANTLPALQRAAADYPGWPLFVTGHSLGGGVAALVTCMLKHSGADLHLPHIRCAVL